MNVPTASVYCSRKRVSAIASRNARWPICSVYHDGRGSDPVIVVGSVRESVTLVISAGGPEILLCGAEWQISGTLGLVRGGTRATCDGIKRILDDLGPKVTHVADNGLALVMKTPTTLSLAGQMLAFSEGVLLAEKSGIPRETAVDVLTHSVIASPMVVYRGPFILKMPEEAWFNVNMMQKDMDLALELGRQLDVPMPTTAVTNEFLTAARGMGLVEKDFAVVFDVLAQMSGVKP